MDAANAQQKNVDKTNDTGVNTPFGVAPGVATPSVAEKMKEKPTSRQKKFWMAWFFVFFLVIIGLIIAIVVVSNTRNSAGNSSDSGNAIDNRTAREIMIADKFEKCMENEDLYDQLMCAEDEYNGNNLSVVQAIFDSMISYYRGQEQYTDAAWLITQVPVFLVVQDNCSAALAFYDGLVLDGYDDLGLTVIYQSAAGTARSCYDWEAEDYWQAKMEETMEKVEDAMSF